MEECCSILAYQHPQHESCMASAMTFPGTPKGGQTYYSRQTIWYLELYVFQPLSLLRMPQLTTVSDNTSNRLVDCPILAKQTMFLPVIDVNDELFMPTTNQMDLWLSKFHTLKLRVWTMGVNPARWHVACFQKGQKHFYFTLSMHQLYTSESEIFLL